MVGQTISHYKVLEKIGEGGMGVVYRATDTKLNRDVALKILPQQFASDAQRMARFQREAEVLASLDHPNIGQIYGIEEAGQTKALVLQLIEGPTLAEKIAQGPIPVEDALKIALQMAEGLEAAHEKGVIHRDLKPANIKITPEGQVKILDFGLAKALEGETPPDANLSQSPTLTAAATQAGVILGTAAYMSPEQAKGKPLDKRTDIWAFGAVLYEMLTAQQAFSGEDVAEILAAVIMKEPNFEQLSKKVPDRLQELIQRCLRKDRKMRFPDIAEARILTQEYLADPSAWAADVSAVQQLSKRRQTLLWGVTGLLGVALLISWVVLWQATRPLEQTPVRLQVQLSSDQSINMTGARAVILSPDGKRLVYVAGSGRYSHLYVRALDQLEATPLPGTDGAQYPFFSPDGEWVAFFLGPGGQRTLKKVPVRGGAAVTISQQPHAGYSGSWGADGTIIIGNQVGVLSGLSDSGGFPEPLTVLKEGEVAHVFPQILPGGKAVLFTAQVSGNWDDSKIILKMLGTGERKVLIDGGTDARYVPTGHLVYSQEGTLLAVPFDLSSLEVTGSPVSILELVVQVGAGAAQFSFSNSGSLVYHRGTGGNERRMMVWADREGHEEPLIGILPNSYGEPRISPDGRRVVLGLRDSGNFDIWTYDLARETMTRLTFEAAVDISAIWTPDGQRVVFASTRDDGFENLYWRAADGTGQVERLTESPNKQVPQAFSPDGKQLVFSERDPAGGMDLNVLSMEGEFTAEPLHQTPFHERDPAISPDGRWLAYVSNESGEYQVYVRPFPNVEDGKWQVSTSGGTIPVWGRQGRELFYRNGEAMMVVGVETEPTFSAGNRTVLFTGRHAISNRRNYDISADGQSFLMIKDVEQAEETSARTELIMVLNWFEELKRLVPTDY